MRAKSLFPNISSRQEYRLDFYIDQIQSVMYTCGISTEDWGRDVWLEELKCFKISAAFMEKLQEATEDLRKFVELMFPKCVSSPFFDDIMDLVCKE